MRAHFAFSASVGRVHRTAAVLFAVMLSLLSASAPAQTLAPEVVARFDRGDRLARALISTVRCAGSVAQAREDGLFGPLDSLGGNGQCVTADGKRVGIFFDADSQLTHVTRFSAVDLGTRARRIAPLDTLAILALARAERTGQMRGITAFEDAHRPYAPLAFRFDGDSIEVWIFPVAVVTGQPPSVGGERGYVFSPDGRTLVREVDAFADFRSIAVADTGTVYLTSRSMDVPTLSEFVLANALNGQGRTVSIVTPWGQSVLAGRGAQSVWMQLVKPRR